jgi:hypothetical protein
MTSELPNFDGYLSALVDYLMVPSFNYVYILFFPFLLLFYCFYIYLHCVYIVLDSSENMLSWFYSFLVSMTIDFCSGGGRLTFFMPPLNTHILWYLIPVIWLFSFYSLYLNEFIQSCESTKIYKLLDSKSMIILHLFHGFLNNSP